MPRLGRAAGASFEEIAAKAMGDDDASYPGLIFHCGRKNIAGTIAKQAKAI